MKYIYVVFIVNDCYIEAKIQLFRPEQYDIAIY